MPEQRRVRALVVDDQPVNRLVLSRMLEVLGVSCETAEDGAAALQQLDREVFDYVFVDLVMPGLSGIDVVRAWRAREHRRARVVAVTGADDVDVRHSCLTAGFDDVLTKPVALATLRDALAAVSVTTHPADESVLHPVLETDRLAELTDQVGAAVVAETVELFLEGLAERRRQLAAALDAADPEALTRAAHTLKSAAATVGASRLAALCAGLEQIGRTGGTPGAGSTTQVDGAVEAARSALERWVGLAADRV